MLTFLQKISTKNLRESLVRVFIRMPLSVILSVITFVLLLVRVEMTHVFSEHIQHIFDTGILSLVVTFFLSIAVYLFAESVNATMIKRIQYQAFPLLFGALFFYFFEENLFDNFYAEVIVYSILTLIGVVTSLFVAPFFSGIFKSVYTQRVFYNHIYVLATRIIASCVVGGAAILLGVIGLATIDALFSISVSDFMSYWIIFSATLFAPIFFLAQLPKIPTAEDYRPEKEKFFAFVLQYIGLPAITVYLLILYAYTVKVLLNFSQWPNGHIAWMVIGFSTFGYIVYMASYGFESTFKPARIFRKIFPFVLLPQIAMLFYAIFLRINQYDITMNRYLVVLFGVWLLTTSAYLIFSRNKYLGMIPFMLVVIISIASIGPWSLYVYPEERQVIHLKKTMSEVGMYVDGNIIPLEKNTDISPQKSGEIYSGIRYICEYHSCAILEDLFAKELQAIREEDKKEFEKWNDERIIEIQENRYGHSDEKISDQIQYIKNKEYTPMNDWEIISDLTSVLKVKKYYSNTDAWEIERYISFRSSVSELNRIFDVAGYQYMISLRDSDRSFGRPASNVTEPMYTAYIDYDSNELQIKKYDVIVERFALNQIFEKLLTQQDKNITPEDSFGYRETTIVLPEESMTFEFNGSERIIKVLFAYVDVENPEWEKTDDEDVGHYFRSTQGYVLIKEK